MNPVHHLPDNWLSAAMAPADIDLEVGVMGNHPRCRDARLFSGAHRQIPLGRCEDEKARRHRADALARVAD
jgi:uncharacterized protein (DUF983 family)